MIAKTRTFMLATLAAAIVSVPAHAVRHYDILMSGYYNGPSVSGTFGLANIFEKVLVGAEVNLGYSWTAAGDGSLARDVFINQNDGGDEDAHDRRRRVRRPRAGRSGRRPRGGAVPVVSPTWPV